MPARRGAAGAPRRPRGAAARPPARSASRADSERQVTPSRHLLSPPEVAAVSGSGPSGRRPGAPRLRPLGPGPRDAALEGPVGGLRPAGAEHADGATDFTGPSESAAASVTDLTGLSVSLS